MKLKRIKEFLIVVGLFAAAYLWILFAYALG